MEKIFLLALNKMHLSLLPLIFGTFLFLGCDSPHGFDSEQWQSKGLDWQMGTTRENMVANLMESDTLIGLTMNEVIQLLGRPEFSDTNKIGYLVREHYSRDIDPEYITYFWVEFNANNTVERCLVKE